MSDARFSKLVMKARNRLLKAILGTIATLGVGFSAPLIAAIPERVASLNMCTDELVLLLAAPEQVISVTHLAQDRHEFAFWRTARRYEANDGSIASVAGMRPDLILTMGGLARDHARLAERIGAEIVILRYPQTLDDVETAIMQVATALGREARARRYIAALRRLEASRPDITTEAVFLSDGGLSVASGSLDAQWLALAGIAIPARQAGPVTAEQMLINPPATVVRSDYREGQASRGQFWPGFRFLERSPQTRILSTDGRRWTCSGLSLLPEIMRLREALTQ